MENTYENMVDVCVNSAMANLRGMTNEQLERILNDESRIIAIIEALPQVRSLPSEREVGLTENKTLAEWNLGQEDRVVRLREDVQRNHAKATSLRTECETMKTKLGTNSSEQSLDVVANLLQDAAQEADEEAEALTHHIYEGDMTPEIFLKQFHDKKSLAHTRKLKCDRLAEILRDQQYTPKQPGYSTFQQPPLPNSRNSTHNFF